MRPDFENQPVRQEDETLLAPTLNNLMAIWLVQAIVGFGFVSFGVWFALVTKGWFVALVFILLGAGLAVGGIRQKFRKGKSK